MIFETTRFIVEVGVIGDDKDPQYLVRNKEHGVVEFCNTSVYFVRDWATQMTKALDRQDWEIEHPGEIHPDDLPPEDDENVLKFPGGKGGRTN
jgi:hypothetical protein